MIENINKENLILTTCSQLKKICKNIAIDEIKLSNLRKKLRKFGTKIDSVQKNVVQKEIIAIKTLIYLNKWRRDHAFEKLTIKKEVENV